MSGITVENLPPPVRLWFIPIDSETGVHYRDDAVQQAPLSRTHNFDADDGTKWLLRVRCTGYKTVELEVTAPCTVSASMVPDEQYVPPWGRDLMAHDRAMRDLLRECRIEIHKLWRQKHGGVKVPTHKLIEKVNAQLQARTPALEGIITYVPEDERDNADDDNDLVSDDR